jgi:dTDP-glucose 4,6-dehydratase
MGAFVQGYDPSLGDEGRSFLTQHFSGRHTVVLGGAGFLGAHISARLAALGAQVTVVDSFLTSRPDTVRDLRAKPHIEVIEADITHEIPVQGSVDFVLNFASPASPVDYVQLPLETLRVGSIGTENALQLAKRTGATFMTASTSEVYGDPAVSPQHEGYWGHVNPIGPRSMYDESKRYAEAITMAYHRMHQVQVRMPRIFNTYGPGMRSNDGRAVPSFISSAIHGEPILIHGDGMQTRSLCHVGDLVEGLLRLLASDHNSPVNLGNTHEVTMLELAKTVIELAGSRSEIRHIERTGDDPQQRRPDLSLASRLLGFQPRVDTEVGLRETIAWFREHEVTPLEAEHITISLSELEQEDATTPYTRGMTTSA